LYYVHNPESQLSAVRQEEFWERLGAAFELLEQNVAQTRIRKYGVATWNGFRAEPNAREYHSLERMVEVARAAGGAQHHFGFIQFALNLAMPAPLFFQNQPLGDEFVSTSQATETL